jgi:hypothetical protein
MKPILPKLGRKAENMERPSFSLLDEEDFSSLFEPFESLEEPPADEDSKRLKAGLLRRLRLHQVFSRIGHQSSDASDYELTFEGVDYEELSEEAAKHFDLGDIRRLLTKRFIKTVRGSSYEVDLRRHESVSLLENIKNQLIKEIYQMFLNYWTTSNHPLWLGSDLSIVIIEGLSISDKGDYESLVHDQFFFEVCKLKKRRLEITHVANEVLDIIKEKTQLKYVDFKSLEAQVHKLEAGGHLRPNINNHQGFIGLRFFPTISYFKMYSLDDCLSKNSAYLSKDAEDRLAFLDVCHEWQPSLGPQLQRETELICKQVRKANKLTMVFMGVERKTLKNRIISRHIMNSEDEASIIKGKFTKNIQVIAKKFLFFQKINHLFGKNCLRQFKLNIEQKTKEQAIAATKARFLGLAISRVTQDRQRLLTVLKKRASSLASIVRIANKCYFLSRLASRAESFLMIKRWDQRKSKLVRGIKIGDNIIRGILASQHMELKSSAFQCFQKINNVCQFSTFFKHLAAKRSEDDRGEAFHAISSYSLDKKNLEVLKSQSIGLLRKNYLLNNVCFIVKYRHSLLEQLHLRQAFNQIKIESSKNKGSEERIKKFCNILDSAMKKGIIRITQNSLKSRLSLGDCQNFKVGFHFLELYIKRRTLSTGFKNIKSISEYEDALLNKLQIVQSALMKSKISKIFRLLRAMSLLRQRLSSLTGLIVSKRHTYKRFYGQIFFSGLKAIRKLYKIRLEQRVLMAHDVLLRVQKNRIFSTLKRIPKKKAPSIRVPALKLELILLKAIKHAYQAGFFSIHKKMVKQIHLTTQAKAMKRSQAISLIQAFLKMCFWRRKFKKMKQAVLVIQRNFRRKLKIKSSNLSQLQNKVARQRKRLTELRENAILRLKEHSILPQADHQPAQTPFKRQIQNTMSKKTAAETSSKRSYCENIVQTTNKLQQIGQRRLAMGKENEMGFLQVRQPASMMKLNMDSNNRENIKRFKNKVITNHIRERGRELVFEEKSDTSEIFERSKVESVKLGSSTDSQHAGDNLQDLILGVKSKIQQIRLTQRSRKDTLN